MDEDPKGDMLPPEERETVEERWGDIKKSDLRLLQTAANRGYPVSEEMRAIACRVVAKKLGELDRNEVVDEDGRFTARIVQTLNALDRTNLTAKELELRTHEVAEGQRVRVIIEGVGDASAD